MLARALGVLMSTLYTGSNLCKHKVRGSALAVLRHSCTSSVGVSPFPCVYCSLVPDTTYLVRRFVMGGGADMGGCRGHTPRV